MDTAGGLFILKPEQAEKTMAAAAYHRRWVKARALRSFCGLAVSSSLSVMSARLHLRALYTCLGGGNSGYVRLDHQAMWYLVWWLYLTSHAGLGLTLWPPPPARTLHTDASSVGLGSVLDQTMPACGLLSPRRQPQHIYCVGSQRRSTCGYKASTDFCSARQVDPAEVGPQGDSRRR